MSTPRRRARESVVVLTWAVIVLVIGDLAVSALFPMPKDPNRMPGAMAQFFSYGESVETKLRRLIGPDDRRTGPIAMAGWRDQPIAIESPDHPDHPAHLIAAYGMSFIFHIGYEMRDLAPEDEPVALILRGGPAAPLNHSYAMFLHDRDGLEERDVRVVILGVRTLALRALHTLTHATWNFESPAPYTYPRYVLAGGELHAVEPLIRNLDEWRDALADETRWAQWLEQLRGHDAHYSSFFVKRDAVDRSSIGRLIRRGLWQRRHRMMSERYWDAGGFRHETGVLELAEAILSDFAAKTREIGALPVVVLIHSRGSDDRAHETLAPALAERGIPHLSTRDIIDPDNPANYRPDGHFIPEADRAIAEALWSIIDSHSP